MPLKAHENILVFYKKLPTYNPQKSKTDRKDIGRIGKLREGSCQHYDIKRIGQYIETGYRYPTDVISFSNWDGTLLEKTDKATKHPTQKPVALLEYLIKTYTNENDLVLDNCAGSFSTAIACINTGRRFIGYELDEKYFEIGKNRILDHLAKKEEMLF